MARLGAYDCTVSGLDIAENYQHLIADLWVLPSSGYPSHILYISLPDIARWNAKDFFYELSQVEHDFILMSPGIGQNLSDSLAHQKLQSSGTQCPVRWVGNGIG